MNDWTETIWEIEHERIVTFAIHALGLLSTTEQFELMTPQEIFDLVYEIKDETMKEQSISDMLAEDYYGTYDEISQQNIEHRARIAALEQQLAALQAEWKKAVPFLATHGWGGLKFGEFTEDFITDGFGNYWPRTCHHCGAPMQVVRPGDARCSDECYIRKDEDE